MEIELPFSSFVFLLHEKTGFEISSSVFSGGGGAQSLRTLNSQVAGSVVSSQPPRVFCTSFLKNHAFPTISEPGTSYRK